MTSALNIRRWVRIGTAIAVGLSFGCCSVARADYSVQVCGSQPNFFVFSGYSTNPTSIFVEGNCPVTAYNGGGLAVFNTGNASAGQAGRVQTNAPAGLELTGAYVSQVSSSNINDGDDWGGGFYWANGGYNTDDQTDANPNFGLTFPTTSRYFGLQMVCGKTACTHAGELVVGAVTLYVRETVGPSFGATGLWQTSGWIRGSWPFSVSADSPSGVCSLSATLNGLNVDSSASSEHLAYAYKQCGTPPISDTVDTTRYGDGAMPLVLSAADAAGVPASLTKTVYVDNTQPTVSLSGPTDASSTAGTQYLSAAASAGPSGVDGISCAVDGAPAQWYPGASAQVPVSGVGQHSVSCVAANNAVDASGNHGWSAPATWSLHIGDPTINGITFGRVVDALRCKRVRERIKVAAHWVPVRHDGKIVRRHGKVFEVRVRAHFTIKKVTKCHPRTQMTTVTVRVRVRRHGRIVWVKQHRRERVVLLPHHKNAYKLRVGHGKTATVSGWLGNYAGVALGGQTITVLTDPNNGLGQFTPAAVATTSATGWWGVKLPAGPSRLVEAVYNGAATTEGSVSNEISLTVPAKIRLLSVSPLKVGWGGTVRLVGELADGYLPPGGALVRLRIGEGSAQTTYGVREHVGGSGRFATTYTFGAGVPSIHRTFWFELASLPTGNYPYAPATSRRLSVVVGGHPAPPRRTRHRRH